MAEVLYREEENEEEGEEGVLEALRTVGKWRLQRSIAGGICP